MGFAPIFPLGLSLITPFYPHHIKHYLLSFSKNSPKGKLRKATAHFLLPLNNINSPLPKNNLRKSLINLDFLHLPNFSASSFVDIPFAFK